MRFKKVRTHELLNSLTDTLAYSRLKTKYLKTQTDKEGCLRMKDKKKEYLVFHRESCNVEAPVSSFKMIGKSQADIRKKFNVINHVITDIKLIKDVEDSEDNTGVPPVEIVENEVIVEDYNPLEASPDIEQGKVKLNNGLIVPESRYKEYCKSLKKIQTCYSEAGKLYLEIGCELYKVEYCGLYALELVNNIYEYAANNFGISRGTTNEYLNVVKNFCEYEAGEWSAMAHPIPVLKEEFRDYSVSQLVILMRVESDKLRKKLVPSMSTRKMKELIKEEKKVEQSKIEHSKEEQPKVEQPNTEQPGFEKSKAELPETKQIKDDRQSLTNGKYIALVSTECSFVEEMNNKADKYEKVINGFRFKVQLMIYDNGCWYDEQYDEFKEDFGNKVISWQAMPTVNEML